MEEIEFSRWLFDGRLRQGKNVLPDGLNWLCYLAGNSKSHRENSISFIFLECPHQVNMKNIVKCYFNALKTHGVVAPLHKAQNFLQFNIQTSSLHFLFFGLQLSLHSFSDHLSPHLSSHRHSGRQSALPASYSSLKSAFEQHVHLLMA